MNVETQSSLKEYLEPIVKFKSKLSHCFGPLEMKRRQIKTALQKFINEIFSEIKIPTRPKLPNANPIPGIPGIPRSNGSLRNYEQLLPENSVTTHIPENVRYKMETTFSSSITSDNITSTTEGLPETSESNSKKTASDLITTHGYKVETHTVITVDGYKLTVNRILAITPGFTSVRKVALLHHGLLGSSIDWLLLGPNRSLPYLLSDHGYDVWLANARGNKYSKDHLNLDIDTKEYWDFSWHEIGHLDMSAVIDYIRENTRKKALIHFIGHSMGATALLVLLSTVPHYSLYLHSAILLAPLSFLFQVKGPLRYIAEGKNNRFLGNKEFVTEFPEHIVKQFCKGEEDLCTNPLILMANGGIDANIQSVKHQLYDQTPGGGSTKTILHYAQLIQSGLFQRFDYGTVKNLFVYGKAVPPEYALNEISSPLVVISSPSDWLSSTRDVETLSAHLTCDVTHHIIKRPGFSHIDFLWADDAPLLVYRLVLNLLQEIKDKSEALMV